MMATRSHVLQFCLLFIAERAEGPWPIDDGPDPDPQPPRRRAVEKPVDADRQSAARHGSLWDADQQKEAA
jgi:hypothetical protein